VISLGPLRAFWTVHPDAEVPLRLWYRTARSAAWQSLNQVRRTYPHADAVRTASGHLLTVFNVCGNKYRLIVRIRHDFGLVNVRCVLTHAEYDRGRWKE
jgi:mRNA interferase HigB